MMIAYDWIDTQLAGQKDNSITAVSQQYAERWQVDRQQGRAGQGTQGRAREREASREQKREASSG